MIALIYSCATDNSIYRSLAQQVEHIFYNGSPYKQEAYTKGVDKPVGPVSEFFDLLLTWNAQSADGLFAAGAEDEEDEIDVGPPSRVVLSETPIDAIWLRLRQFHSVTLAEKLIRERGRRDNLERPEQAWRTKAEGVAFALRNATDYFQSDVGRNVSQRILNLYYGSMAFAFAEMLASPRGPATLAEIEDSTKQGHGLYTLDGPTAGLQDLVVGPLISGFFPSWLRFLEADLRAFPSKKPKTPTDLAAQVSGHHVTMEQLFARIPEVADIYSEIFDSPALWLTPTYDGRANMSMVSSGDRPKPSKTYATLIDSSGLLTREDIARFPGAFSEIQPLSSQGRHKLFRVAVDHTGKPSWWDAPPLHHSPLGATALIMPVFPGVGAYRHICIVLLYALSIVVRYRPSLWRRVQEGDLDNMRVLIEAFLAVVERVLPEQFLAQVTDQRITAKQPGSFF